MPVDAFGILWWQQASAARAAKQTAELAATKAQLTEARERSSSLQEEARTHSARVAGLQAELCTKQQQVRTCRPYMLESSSSRCISPCPLGQISTCCKLQQMCDQHFPSETPGLG